MTGKKIEFSKRPNIEDAGKFIDNRVSGNIEIVDKSRNLKRTTIYLPDDLHQKLKMRAVSEKTTMTEIIIGAIKNYMH